MKYHIEKNTVQETLVIPLYGRKMCSTLYPRLFYDETAIRLMDEIDYDFTLLEKKSKSLKMCIRDRVYTVVQGEKMGRPSRISAQVTLKDGQPFVKVGGPAVTLAQGEIAL